MNGIGQCERNPNCIRGYKHQYKGGHCCIRLPAPTTTVTAEAPQLRCV